MKLEWKCRSNQGLRVDENNSSLNSSELTESRAHRDNKLWTADTVAGRYENRNNRNVENGASMAYDLTKPCRKRCLDEMNEDRIGTSSHPECENEFLRTYWIARGRDT